MTKLLPFNPYFLFFAFFISALGAFVILRLGSMAFLIDTPNERSSHIQPTPRGGGVGIWLSFIIASFLTAYSIEFIVIVGLIGLIGLVEDRFELSSKVRLISQFVLSATVIVLYGKFLGFSSGYLVLANLTLFLFWIVFIVGTTNFFNFMDGIDGIAALTGIIGFGLMAIFSLLIIKDAYIFSTSLVLVIACFGFLPFNFPKAKVFMGDVGSIFLGFVFASFVLRLTTSITILLCLAMFLGTFYADAILTIFARWRRGERLTTAHRSHLYQYLSNELMLPHWLVAVAYAFVQLIIGLLAILAYKKNITWQALLITFYSISFIVLYGFVKSIKPKNQT